MKVNKTAADRGTVVLALEQRRSSLTAGVKLGHPMKFHWTRELAKVEELLADIREGRVAIVRT